MYSNRKNQDYYYGRASAVVLGNRIKYYFRSIGQTHQPVKKATYILPSWTINLKQNINYHHYHRSSLCMINIQTSLMMTTDIQSSSIIRHCISIVVIDSFVKAKIVVVIIVIISIPIINHHGHLLSCNQHQHFHPVIITTIIVIATLR